MTKAERYKELGEKNQAFRKKMIRMHRGKIMQLEEELSFHLSCIESYKNSLELAEMELGIIPKMFGDEKVVEKEKGK